MPVVPRIATVDAIDRFAAFYGAEYPAAVRLAHLLTGDSWAAEDLAQEVFERVHVRFTTLDRPAAFLQTSLVNACRSHHRRRQRDVHRLSHLARPEVVSAEARELLDVLDTLPYRQKAVLVLRYYADLSEAEIAELLGCRPGTVKSLAARGLTRLAEEIQP